MYLLAGRVTTGHYGNLRRKLNYLRASRFVARSSSHVVNQFLQSSITVNMYKEKTFTENEKKQIIYEYHNTPLGGHSGVFTQPRNVLRRLIFSCKRSQSPTQRSLQVSQIVKRLKLNYQWTNLKQFVKQYIENRKVCQKSKIHLKTKQPMLITYTVKKSFERIWLDIVL
ncbi:Retrovirus-related Pol polyprotein [Aphis craccivora]|uniref:Retrovirus-related Pol polyprotein n=1 Tax=Aphis craccivora TaxID=307492 RepID=A0A6G0ZKB9_APHCR|nr:Retrovirus-related Pol polyprotein [Aphis craccivora]